MCLWSTLFYKPLPVKEEVTLSLRDLLAELLKEILKMWTLRHLLLLPLTGETLLTGSNLRDGARLDVSCRNWWSPLDKALIDVRVFNPKAESYWKKTIQQARCMCHMKERRKHSICLEQFK